MNTHPGEQEILHTALLSLKRITGLSATALDYPQGAFDRGIDAQVIVQTDRGERQFVAEIKAVDRFQTPAQVKTKLEPYTEHPLLVAPFITSEMASRCRDLHLSFIDTAGNAYLEAPGLFVYVTGQPDPKGSKKSRFRSVASAGLQVSFTLLARPALLHAPYREIAQAANVSLGTVTHVMRDLASRGILREDRTRGLLDPQRLIEEWVTYYPINLRPKLNPRRFEATQERIAEADLVAVGAYWGGEPAAQQLTQYLQPAQYTVYMQAPINRLVADLRLKANPNGNVEVLETFWNFEADPKYSAVVPPVLVYADLLATHDGRNAEIAKLVYERHIEPTFHTS